MLKLFLDIRLRPGRLGWALRWPLEKGAACRFASRVRCSSWAFKVAFSASSCVTRAFSAANSVRSSSTRVFNAAHSVST
jgi:hypothetical protein